MSLQSFLLKWTKTKKMVMNQEKDSAPGLYGIQHSFALPRRRHQSFHWPGDNLKHHAPEAPMVDCGCYFSFRNGPAPQLWRSVQTGTIRVILQLISILHLWHPKVTDLEPGPFTAPHDIVQLEVQVYDAWGWLLQRNPPKKSTFIS